MKNKFTTKRAQLPLTSPQTVGFLYPMSYAMHYIISPTKEQKSMRRFSIFG